MALSQTHFQNAHHFEVKDGQFMNIASATIINNTTDIDSVTLILRPYVATGAMFDSAERYPPGKCHPGTRQRIIKQIIDWIDDPDSTQSIVWLYGPAGSGKSALAQSICEILMESRSERKGASFFFANGPTDRGNAFKLFTTISYQLAVHFPSVRVEISKALNRDPTLPTKSLEIQILSLIVQPLLECKDLPSHRPIIIVDGLDECADDEEANTQRKIIALIAKLVVDHKLPLRFIIASRPEYWIRDAFDVSPLPAITKSLSLRDEYDTDQDIRSYLIDEFERIRVENRRVMGSVALPWPPTEVIDRFVYEASGQFIYASTILKFVGKSSKFSNPQTQLLIIISLGPQRASAFSELDRLYMTILSAYPRWETMKRVLGGLLVYANTTIVRVFLSVDPDEIVLVMESLSSLIDKSQADVSLSTERMLLQSLNSSSFVFTDRDAVSFSHLSFLEFLKDRTRSGTFHIDVEGFRDEITQALFGMIHRSLDLDHRTERYITLNLDFVTYQVIMHNVASHSLRHYRIDTLLPLITHMTERLLPLADIDSGRSMKSLVCFAEDMKLFECAIQAFFDKFNFRPDYAQWQSEERKEVDGLKAACKRFQEVVFLAQKRATCGLTLCSEFKVTPVLVYLAEFRRGTEWISSQILSTIPGTIDVISTIKGHRHFMHLSYFYSKRQWGLQLVELKTLFSCNHRQAIGPHINIQDSDEWKEQRIFLVRHMLKSDIGKDWRYINSIEHNNRLALKECFFDVRSITDICGTENLPNVCECLSLLEIIGGLHPQQTMRDFPWTESCVEAPGQVPDLTTSIICWLNRQLTNPQILKLLHKHNTNLLQKMTTTVRHLFERVFLPEFDESYDKQLRMRVFPTYDIEHVTTITALPLPGGYRQHNTYDDFYIRSVTPDWHTFHDEVFGLMDGSSPPIIVPSYWYPLLASRLLIELVKFLYGEVNPRFSISNIWERQSWDGQLMPKFKKSLSYITQCLPLAHPTLENLDALRLIVYLYPQITHTHTVLSLLPEGIWLSIGAFLKKYDRSVLSSEELDLFESWLYSKNHKNIKKYLPRSPQRRRHISQDQLEG